MNAPGKPDVPYTPHEPKVSDPARVCPMCHRHHANTNQLCRACMDVVRWAVEHLKRVG